MKLPISNFLPLILLVICPPWTAQFPTGRVFVSHSWFWAPPHIHASDYTIIIDGRILLAEALLFSALIVVVSFLWKRRKDKH